tara:strand:+ start:404 stop:1168 length:765 start_codon:yes stop_codon:yes gene_type:complete
MNKRLLNDGRERLKAFYLEATPQQIKAGRLWYLKARALCTALRIAYNKGLPKAKKLTKDQIIKIVAVCSPRLRWENAGELINIKVAKDILMHFKSGGDWDTLQFNCLEHNHRKAFAMLKTWSTGKECVYSYNSLEVKGGAYTGNKGRLMTVRPILSGDKVTAFYYNIQQKSECLNFVTIDTWILSAFFADPNIKEAKNLTGARYADIQKIIIDLAKELNERPEHLQAIIWLVISGREVPTKEPLTLDPIVKELI